MPQLKYARAPCRKACRARRKPSGEAREACRAPENPSGRSRKACRAQENPQAKRGRPAGRQGSLGGGRRISSDMHPVICPSAE